MSDIQERLKDLVENDGVRGALVVDRDGLLIDGYSRDRIDLEAVGALVTRELDHYEDISREMKVGALSWSVFRSQGGSLFIRSLDEDAFLVLVVDEEPRMAPLDGAMERWMPKAWMFGEMVRGSTQIEESIAELSAGEKHG